MIKDTNGKPSTTVTIFIIGSIIANLKLLLSGVAIYGTTIPVFSGAEYAIVMASLGSVYILRRSKLLKSENKNKSK